MQCIPFTFVYTGPAGVRAKRRTGAGQKLPRFSMPVTRSGIKNPAERSETLWQKNRTMATRASRASRAPTACGCARRLFSARTALTAASTRSLRSSPIPSTRRDRAMARRLPLHAFSTSPSRWRTTAAASRSISTSAKTATTGSWFSARCTRAANTTTTTAAITIFRSASTASASARRSTPRNTWMRTSATTDSATRCILSAARTSAA